MGVIFVYNRTNMYICVPVMILCPIIGLIWVLSSRLFSRERKKTNNKRKKVADIPDIIYLAEVKKVIKRRKVATSTQTDENDFLEPVKLIRYEKRYKRFGNKIKNRKKCLEVIELSSDED